MIKLSVQPYCHNCMKFSPELLLDTLYANDKRIVTEQNVVCEHRFECEALTEYLKQELDSRHNQSS